MQQPSSAVLSKYLTEQLFGAEDPIGKVITLTRKGFFDGELIVRGVMENIAGKTSLKHEILATNFTNQLVQRSGANESAVKMLGWTDPIGKTINWHFRSGRIGQVIGVVKDYHAGSFHQKIRPQMLVMEKGDFNYFSMQLHGENLSETVAFVKKTLSSFSPKPLPAQYWFEREGSTLNNHLTITICAPES